MQENTIKQEPQVTATTANTGPTNSTPEVKEELSKVGANPKRNMLVMASMVIGFAVMGYNLLAPILFSKQNTNSTPTPSPNLISAPSTVNADLPPVPQVPEPPKLVDPSPPPPPPPLKANIDAQLIAPPLPLPPSMPPMMQQPSSVPSIPKSTQATNLYKDSDAAKERAEAKRKSSIVLVGGTAPIVKSALESEQANDFKKRGDLAYVLGQGKVIDAVIESAINSDFEGEIRAVISRDVYSENAKIILIPKGTRVFGTFTSDTGTGRVTVNWTKINLESGYTLTMAAIGVDNLGRPGVQGRIDNKYTEQMTNAVLTSAFNVAVATGLDKIIPPVTSTATAAQTASGVTSIISQATAIAGDPNTITPPATTPPYPPVTLGTGGTDNGASAKINAICALKSQITDATSSSYTSMVTACTAAQATLNSANAQGGLSALLSAITGLAGTSAAAAVTNATPTQTQAASKQAFTDITTAAKNMMGQTQFQPTVTIPQGTKIKIYVNKDYTFPKDSINSTKVLH